MIDIHDELRLLVAKLDEQNIEYALCGGLSLQKAKIKREEDRPQGIERRSEAQSESRQKKSQ
jgi:hypothetical protein